MDSPYGGIGRHKRLKIFRLFGRASSNLVKGTISNNTNILV